MQPVNSPKQMPKRQVDEVDRKESPPHPSQEDRSPMDLFNEALEEGKRINRSIRMTNDVPKLISIFDAIGVVCDCDNKEAAQKYNRICANVRSSKKGPIKMHIFGTGRGQNQPTPVDIMSECLLIIQALPAGYPKVDAIKRAGAKENIRHIGGDRNLIAEGIRIAQMHESGRVPENHIAQAARSEVLVEYPNQAIESEKDRDSRPDNIEFNINPHIPDSRQIAIREQIRRDDEAHARRMAMLERREAIELEELRRRGEEMRKRDIEAARESQARIAAIYIPVLDNAYEAETRHQPPNERERVARDDMMANIRLRKADFLERTSAVICHQAVLSAPLAIMPPASEQALILPSEPAQLVLPPSVRKIITFDMFSTEVISKAWINTNRSKIGKVVAAIYRAEHDGKDPPKGPVVVGGRSCMVNTYYEGDEDIIQRAIDSIWLAQHPPAEPVAEPAPAEPVAEPAPAEPVAEPAPAEPVAPAVPAQAIRPNIRTFYIDEYIRNHRSFNRVLGSTNQEVIQYKNRVFENLSIDSALSEASKRRIRATALWKTFTQAQKDMARDIRAEIEQARAE